MHLSFLLRLSHSFQSLPLCPSFNVLSTLPPPPPHSKFIRLHGTSMCLTFPSLDVTSHASNHVEWFVNRLDPTAFLFFPIPLVKRILKISLILPNISNSKTKFWTAPKPSVWIIWKILCCWPYFLLYGAVYQPLRDNNNLLSYLDTKPSSIVSDLPARWSHPCRSLRTQPLPEGYIDKHYSQYTEVLHGWYARRNQTNSAKSQLFD